MNITHLKDELVELGSEIIRSRRNFDDLNHNRRYSVNLAEHYRRMSDLDKRFEEVLNQYIHELTEFEFKPIDILKRSTLQMESIIDSINNSLSRQLRYRTDYVSKYLNPESGLKLKKYYDDYIGENIA